MDGITIKVTTEELVRAADNVETFIGNMRDIFGEIDAVVSRSSSYWDGDGHNSHISSYEKRQERVMTALARFQENAEDLKTIAGVYEKAEDENVTQAQALPTDIIL